MFIIYETTIKTVDEITAIMNMVFAIFLNFDKLPIFISSSENRMMHAILIKYNNDETLKEIKVNKEINPAGTSIATPLFFIIARTAIAHSAMELISLEISPNEII